MRNNSWSKSTQNPSLAEILRLNCLWHENCLYQYNTANQPGEPSSLENMERCNRLSHISVAALLHTLNYKTKNPKIASELAKLLGDVKMSQYKAKTNFEDNLI